MITESIQQNEYNILLSIFKYVAEDGQNIIEARCATCTRSSTIYPACLINGHIEYNGIIPKLIFGNKECINSTEIY